MDLDPFLLKSILLFQFLYCLKVLLILININFKLILKLYRLKSLLMAYIFLCFGKLIVKLLENIIILLATIALLVVPLINTMIFVTDAGLAILHARHVKYLTVMICAYLVLIQEHLI